ncbi:MAG: low specificity L-threonine aldolase [Candidatus Accumulibacter sp.]|jgi:threonine aldolase|nr:low specificity L-threonine aldolase [Accumulibacter sp.]
MIDLRSDTVTLPTEEMLRSMQGLNLADETAEGDPTVRLLEEKAMSLTGKEAAVFVTSGTLGNLLAAKSHAASGGIDIILDQAAHIWKAEFGGVSTVAHLHCTRIPSVKGEMDLDELRDTAQILAGRHGMPPALICMETTHNYSGGSVLSLAYMQSVHEIAKEVGAPAHLDGARLFNAAASLGVPAAEIARHCDTLSFCLSKGLSAPFGAVLLGGGDFIKRARLYRRMLGSGFRQIGLMAAPGLVALNTMVDRLADDNRRCAELWALLRDIDPRLVYEDKPPSNILHLRCIKASSREWAEALKTEGVLCFADGPAKLRFVTHRHITDENLLQTAVIVKKIYSSFSG